MAERKDRRGQTRRHIWRMVGLCVLCLALNLPGWPAAYAQSPASTARLLFVGDIMVGRHVAEIIAEQGAVYPLEPVSPLLTRADIAFGNMESPLATTPRVAGGYDLRADPANAEVIALAGFDIVSLANNHATDNGRDGLLQTMATLSDLGIQWAGAAETLADARTATVLDVNGLRIGFLAYDGTRASFMATADQPGCAWLEPDWVAVDVKKARDVCDILCVSFHWGAEYESLPHARQREIAGKIAAAGADIIIGHHPHVVQPVEWLQAEGRERPTLVAYSLGNFLFDQWFSDEVMQSAILECTVSSEGVLAFGLHPTQNVEGQIVAADAANAGAVLQRLLPATAGRGWQIASQAGLGAAVWQMPPDSGQAEARTLVDLDADGAAERVVVAGGQAWVYAAGNPTLSSPAAWRVNGWATLWSEGADRLLALSMTEPPVRESDSPPAHHSIWQYGGMNRAVHRIYLLRWSGDVWTLAHRSRPLPHPVQQLACDASSEQGSVDCVALESPADGVMRLAGWQWDGGRWHRTWCRPAGRISDLLARDVDANGAVDFLVQYEATAVGGQ